MRGEYFNLLLVTALYTDEIIRYNFCQYISYFVFLTVPFFRYLAVCEPTLYRDMTLTQSVPRRLVRFYSSTPILYTVPSQKHKVISYI